MFRFSAIQQRKIKKSVEYANNRGMACLPLNFNNMLFEKLESAGYIDMSHSDRKLWPGAAVVISSNDSALDIFQHQEISFQQSPFRARESSSDMSVLMFQNPPPMWRLPEQTVFVLTERDSFCEFDVYAEVGPRRKGPVSKKTYNLPVDLHGNVATTHEAQSKQQD